MTPCVRTLFLLWLLLFALQAEKQFRALGAFQETPLLPIPTTLRAHAYAWSTSQPSFLHFSLQTPYTRHAKNAGMV